MVSAKKKDTGDEEFHISQLSKEDNGNLLCQSCNTEIQYTSAYPIGNEGKIVAAYLRLWQHAQHNEHCRYTVKGAVNRLVANSQALENTHSIFEAQPDGSYVFRMNILCDAHHVAQSMSQSQQDPQSNSHSALTRTNYIRSERQLASYFNSAVGIAKIKALLQSADKEDNDELEKLIKIQFDGKLIPWKDFYYDESRYHVLYSRLVKKQIKHPIAINVSLKSKPSYYDGAKRYPWSIQCYKQVEPPKAKLAYIPKLQFIKEELCAQLSPKDNLLVVGNAWAKEPNKDFRNFNIGVFKRSQIKKEDE